MPLNTLQYTRQPFIIKIHLAQMSVVLVLRNLGLKDICRSADKNLSSIFLVIKKKIKVTLKFKTKWLYYN